MAWLRVGPWFARVAGKGGIRQPIFTFTVIPNGKKQRNERRPLPVKSFISLTIARAYSVGYGGRHNFEVWRVCIVL